MMRAGAAVSLLLCGALLGAPQPARAASAGCPFPARATPPSAAEWGLYLGMAQHVQEALEAEGAVVAIVSRAGLNLRPIGQRYSHAGFLQPPVGQGRPRPWSVRQLYWDCDTQQPRIFDEGLASFVSAVASGVRPRLSVLWWPAARRSAFQGEAPEPALSEEPAALLARAVADHDLALRLLSPRYQAHAHAWNLHTQNCNQWLLEVLAAAFGGGRDRAGAQAWLRAQGYEPAVVQLPWVAWLWAAALTPHLGLQHHPSEHLQNLQLHLTLPASVEAFVQQRWPQVQRAEWCWRGSELVVRRGWQPLDEACTPGEGDRRVALSP